MGRIEEDEEEEECKIGEEEEKFGGEHPII